MSNLVSQWRLQAPKLRVDRGCGNATAPISIGGCFTPDAPNPGTGDDDVLV